MPSRVVDCRALPVGILALLITSMVGCGGSDRPATVPVSGHITIDGKPPGENGRLHFQVIEPAPGYTKRPAGGAFAPDGSYRVMSWAPDDGLVPGRYSVSLMPGDPAKTAIPRKYQDGSTSGLEVDVPVDQGAIEYNIEVMTK